MRYAPVLDVSVPRRPASRRSGRCARCHAPVLSDDEHYAEGGELVYGACANAVARINSSALEPVLEGLLDTGV